MATRDAIISNLPGKLDSIFHAPTQFLQVLETWSATPAQQHLWLIRFEVTNPAGASRTFPAVLEKNIIQTMERAGLIGGQKEEWNLASDNKYYNAADFTTAPTCMFVQGVNVPGEKWNADYASVENAGGLVPIMFGGARDSFLPLTTQLYEGNTSFVDTVLRPWIILASHYGLVARNPQGPDFDTYNIKCTIEVTMLAKTVGREVDAELITGKKSPITTTTIQRKKFKFYNAVPVGIGDADLTYASGQGIRNTNVQWAYSHYTVQNLASNGSGQEISALLKDYAETGLGNNWGKIREEYNKIWTAQTSKRKASELTAFRTRYGRVFDIISTKNSRDKARFGMLVGDLPVYGPRGSDSPITLGQVKLPVRWKAVGVTNLCGGVNGRPDVCKPPPPPPGSVLDKLRNGLRNITGLARGARSIVAAFKRVGKAKGIKGKVSALGDLNKQLGKVGVSVGGSGGGNHKTLGGGMPKAKTSSAGTKGLSKAGGIIDDAKKAARAVTGKSKSKGAF